MQRECGCAQLRYLQGEWRPNSFLNRKSALCGCILFAITEVMHRPRDDSPLQIDIRNKYQICMEKQKAGARCLLPATLLKRWLQVCRIKITFELLRTYSFFSTKPNSMKYFVNWIPLNIQVRTNQTQPDLEIGLDIFRMNTDSLASLTQPLLRVGLSSLAWDGANPATERVATAQPLNAVLCACTRALCALVLAFFLNLPLWHSRVVLWQPHSGR